MKICAALIVMPSILFLGVSLLVLTLLGFHNGSAVNSRRTPKAKASKDR